jgi:hypothetical protein
MPYMMSSLADVLVTNMLVSMVAARCAMIDGLMQHLLVVFQRMVMMVAGVTVL